MSDKKKAVLNLSENEIPLSLITADEKENVRSDYRELKELADSIRKHGQLEPVGIDENNNLIYGFRRFKAIKEILNLDSIKYVRVKMKEETREVIQLVENIHRSDLTDYELAGTLNRLKESKDLSDRELSELIGKSLKWVNDKISHYKIAENVETARSLPTSLVNEARSLPEEKQKEILKEAKEKKLSQKETREKVKNSRQRENQGTRKLSGARSQEPSKEDRISQLKKEISGLKKEISKQKRTLEAKEKELEKLIG